MTTSTTMTLLGGTTHERGVQAAATQEETRHGIPWRVLALTAAGAFMAYLDLSLVNVAFPALRASFPDTSAAGLAWVLTAYTIVFAALLITAGRLADRYGRRRAFFVGLGAFATGSAMCGTAPSVALLIIGRTVQAAGASLLVPSSLGLLLAASADQKRSQTVALWGGVGALAVAVGPSFGAVIISQAGWRWAFFLNIPVAAVAWMSGRRVLPPDRVPPSTGVLDHAGVLLLTGSLAGLVLAISQSTEWGWSDLRIVASAVASTAAALAFIGRCRSHSQPVLDLTLFQTRSFAVANAATTTYAMGFFALLLGSVLFLTGIWHYSVLRAGLAMTPAPVVVAAMSGPVGRTAVRIGFRPLAAAGATILAGGLVWFAVRLGIRPHYTSVWLPGYLMMGIGIGLVFPVLSAAAVSGLPPEHFAVGSAVNQACRQVGGTIGVAILVVLLGKRTATLDVYRNLWIYSAAMAATTGAIGLLLPQLTARPPRHHRRPSIERVPGVPLHHPDNSLPNINGAHENWPL